LIKRLKYKELKIRDIPIGDIEEVQSQYRSGELLKKIKQAPEKNNSNKKSTTNPPKAEFPKVKQPTAIEKKEAPVLESKKEEEESIDFDVIHTNFFWKQQRILKFYQENFYRVHPTSGEPRAVRRYDEITRITFVDNGNIIIRYTNGMPDYIRCTPACLHTMVEIIQASSPKEVLIDYYI